MFFTVDRNLFCLFVCARAIGVENKTLASWKEHINSEGGTAGQISSRRTGASDALGSGTDQVGDEEFNVTGKSKSTFRENTLSS